MTLYMFCIFQDDRIRAYCDVVKGQKAVTPLWNSKQLLSFVSSIRHKRIRRYDVLCFATIPCEIQRDVAQHSHNAGTAL